MLNFQAVHVQLLLLLPCWYAPALAYMAYSMDRHAIE